jgi:chromate transporter
MSAGSLPALAEIFSELSLLAVGGANALVPEMQRRVEAQGWMGPAEFAALFALAQAAPGPNMLVVTLVGWRVAGL